MRRGNVFEATNDFSDELVGAVDIVKLLASGLWSLRLEVGASSVDTTER